MDLDCRVFFAKFKTELWMVHDVFEMGPKLPEYLGEHTNEMVAFRCLASLFDSSTSEYVISDDKSTIKFGSYKSCEYVLQCILDEVIETSSEKDTGVSPCKGQEGMRINGKETDQVTSRMADPESFVHDPEDGAHEICRSDALLERSNHSPGDGAEISRSQALLERRDEGFRNGSDGGVSSPSENRYRCSKCKESGKLLFCSSYGCIVMVHEKCVVFQLSISNLKKKLLK